MIVAACVFFFSRPDVVKTAEVVTLAAETQRQRIVSLAPNITEMLFALGLEEEVIAVSSNCDYPPEARTKAVVGTFWQPSTEAIIAAGPDLVITLSFEQHRQVGGSLERLGYKVLTLKMETIEQLYSAIDEIGAAADCRGRADKLAGEIRAELKELKEKFSSEKKVRLLWVLQSEPLRAAGRDTFINELITLAGGENVIEAGSHRYPLAGAEQILTCDAEVIIHSAMGTDGMAEQLKAAESFWSKYPNLPAVKNKRIFVIDSDSVLRLGPRVPEAVMTIARFLRPEICN